MARPDPSEYRAFQAPYVALVPESKVVPILEAQGDLLPALGRGVTPDKETFAYAPGKWTVRQVLDHMTDAERVFGYRLFGICRGDKTSFPPFDENAYVAHADANERPLQDLVEEFVLVRRSNLFIFQRLRDDAWRTPGVVNGELTTPRAIAFVMAGHVRRHLKVLEERYGLSAGP